MDFKKYIGHSYESKNCFVIVKEFYLDHFKLDLKHYYEETTVPERKEIQSLVVTNKGDFVKADKPAFGDIVVINLFGYSCHMGVYIGDGYFLHSIRKIGSCIEPVMRYEKVIDGYYRHRERLA